MSTELIPMILGEPVRLEVLKLAWELEARGITITAGAGGLLTIDKDERLTTAERILVRRWYRELYTLAAYCDSPPSRRF